MSLKMLDEKFARDQIFIQRNIFSVKPMQYFKQHGIFVILDEILHRFNKAFILLVHEK